MNCKKVEIEKAFIYWDERGFVRVECKLGEKLGLEDAIAINKARRVVAPQKKHLCLFRAKQISYVSRGSRGLAAHKETEDITIAFALVFSSSIGRVLGNFFIQVDKPQYPTKLFTNEEEAVTWLMQFKSLPEGKNDQ